MELEESAFDLVECLHEIGDLMAPQASAKGLAYRFVSPVARHEVFGDAGRLRQIVLNLLGNAIKFTERGSVELALTVGEVAEIAVRDTGIGIPPEQLPLLFKRFAQGDSSMVRKYEGTGLGLALSREMAQLMGGEIGVTSEHGKGSEFVLKVPLKPYGGEGVARKRIHAVHVPGVQRTKPRRVLLAEDNAVNQKLAVRLLERLGCRVDVAGNGREAVDMTERFPYDLIFMDCRMPEMDGYEASRRIRARHGAHTPIVALTAHAVEGAREECIGAGMDDYLTKPVRPPDLERMLVRWNP